MAKKDDKRDDKDEMEKPDYSKKSDPNYKITVTEEEIEEVLRRARRITTTEE